MTLAPSFGTMKNGGRNSLRAGKQFWTGRMFTPLKAVVALTWTIHADRAGVWGSPLRPPLTPLAQYPAPTISSLAL